MAAECLGVWLEGLVVCILVVCIVVVDKVFTVVNRCRLLADGLIR